MAQLADEVVANRGADPIPGRALGEGVDDIRAAGATRRTVEGAGAACMRVGTHQDATRQGIGMLGDDDMGDTLVVANVVEARDAKFFDKGAANRMRARAKLVGCRHRSEEQKSELQS